MTAILDPARFGCLLVNWPSGLYKLFALECRIGALCRFALAGSLHHIVTDLQANWLIAGGNG